MRSSMAERPGEIAVSGIKGAAVATPNLRHHESAPQAQADVDAGVPDAAPIPPASAGAGVVVDAALAAVRLAMSSDRKTTALKALQGHIWRQGFASGALRGELYGDVPGALEAWRRAGVKTYIYSSGSRCARLPRPPARCP